MLSLFVPVLFFASFFLLFRRRFDGLASVGLGGAVGFLAFSWVSLAGYWLFGLQAGFWLAAVVGALLLGTVLIFGANQGHGLPGLAASLRGKPVAPDCNAVLNGRHKASSGSNHAGKRFSLPDFRAAWRAHKLFFVFLFFAAALFAFLFSSHSLEVRPDGLYSAGYAWGDLAFHLGVVNYFLHGASFPPAYVVFDSVLGYPFLADFSSAVLALGASLQAALVFSGLVWVLSFFVLSYCAGLKMGFTKEASVLALVLLLLGGGLGFADFFRTSLQGGLGNALDGGFGAALAARDYANLEPTGWTNVVTSLFLPQRTLLFGAAVFVAVFLLLLHAQRKRDFVVAGILAGLMPFVHWHSFLVLMGVALVYAVAGRDRRQWGWGAGCLWFFVPAVLLALPQALWSLQQLAPSFFKLSPNWLANTLDLGAAAAFWLAQTGLWIPTVMAGVLLAAREQRFRFLPFALLFGLASVVVFQPHAYDNIKFFFYVQWFAAFLIAALLLQMAGRESVGTGPKRKMDVKIGLVLKALAVLLFLVLVASGFLSVARETGLHWRLYDTQDVQLAEWAKANTPRDAVFLTASNHNEPVSSLAGRHIVMGYPGWLWSHGFSYAKTEADVKAMFAGDAALMREYGVSYAVIGAEAKRGNPVNEAFWSAKTLVFSNSAYSVYLVG